MAVRCSENFAFFRHSDILSNTDGLAVKPMDVAVYAKQVVRVARAFDLGETPVIVAVGGGPVVRG